MNKGLKSHESVAVSPLGTKIAFLGTGGFIHIICGLSKLSIGDIKMNTAARSIVFASEEILISSGLDADVYVWDLRYAGQGRCLSKFKNDDGTCSSSLGCYQNDRSNKRYSSIFISIFIFIFVFVFVFVFLII